MPKLSQRIQTVFGLSSASPVAAALQKTYIGKIWKKKAGRILLIVLSSWFLFYILFSIFLWFLPLPSFPNDYSTVLYSRDDQLMGASIATDEQWRFPMPESLPKLYQQALLLFEDKYFFFHGGIDPLAIARGLRDNWRAGRIVSGASTISMQVVRLALGVAQRSYGQKVWEMLLTLRLEQHYSKAEILRIYAAHAPMGGNVVGLEAAAWRYFSRNSTDLSAAEYALLAILPNNPGILHLNSQEGSPQRARLKNKRDLLLSRLARRYQWSEDMLDLAIAEALPDRASPLPQLAKQLLGSLQQEEQRQNAARHFRLEKPVQNGIVRSTLSFALQEQATQIIARHQSVLAQNQVYNSAALILDTRSAEVLAYIGNSPPVAGLHENDVDVVRAPRSSGSLLKPLLYAAMLEEGEILPQTVIPDIPANYAGFSPENFNRSYQGAVPADQVIIESLNVPSVWMLSRHGVSRFYNELRELGLSTLFRKADDYGLSLIIGGSEVTLWEITGLYAALGRSLLPDASSENNSGHEQAHFFPYLKRSAASISGLGVSRRKESRRQAILSPGSIYLMFQAMQKLNRPGADTLWESLSSSQSIAWKTGTSFGNRDAWAIGVSPSYTIGVWVGNATGQGRPDLVGVQSAAPILFDLFRSARDLHFDAEQERSRGGFPRPAYDAEGKQALIQVEVCRKSGMQSSPNCSNARSWVDAPVRGAQSPVDPYYQLVHLSADRRWQVHIDSGLDMISEYRFVLPPAMEYFYQKNNPGYQVLPPFYRSVDDKSVPIGILSPQANSEIYIPFELGGLREKVVIKATHREPNAVIYWHLNQEYLGFTQGMHQMEIAPDIGVSRITLVDQYGNRLARSFLILEK